MKQKLKFFITLIGFLLPFVAVLFLLTYLDRHPALSLCMTAALVVITTLLMAFLESKNFSHSVNQLYSSP